MASCRRAVRALAAVLAALVALPASTVAGAPAVAAATDASGRHSPAGIGQERAAHTGDLVAVVRRADGTLAVEEFATAAASGGDLAAELAHLRARPDVVAADVDVPTRALAGDPLRPAQWPLDTLAAEDTWRTATGAGVTVAVLDTGVQADHPDLRGRVLAGADFSGTGRDGRTDVSGHGTHVAGIVAAARGNGVGTVGLGHGARVLPVQVLGDTGAGKLSWAAQGIIWAVDNGADVVTMSFGASSGSTVLDAAVAHAVEAGVTLVASSGNDGDGRALWPAAHRQVIAVGATDAADRVPTFSNADPALDLVAPGDRVPSTCVTSRWCTMSGTSMAAPHVAAAVAALLEVDGSLGPDAVATLLRATAVDLGPRGHDAASGHGRIDLSAALRAAAWGSADPFAADGTGLRHIADTTVAERAAVDASRATFPTGAALAVVARDDVFADSLTGAALAGGRGPVLFTPGGAGARLGAAVAAELDRVLAPGAPVYVLGGAAAVSDEAFAAIAALGLAPERIAGSDRVVTAAAVADRVASGGARVERVLLARADHWADAVAGSAFAAASGTPVLLTPTDRLHPVTASWLVAHDVGEVVVLGGEAAVSSTVATQIGGTVDRVARVSGPDRAATAGTIARQLWGRTVGSSGDRYVVVEGYAAESWAPAIAAAVLSATTAAPQLLVHADRVPAGTAGYLTALGYEDGRTAQATAVGGRITAEVGWQLLDLLGRTVG